MSWIKVFDDKTKIGQIQNVFYWTFFVCGCCLFILGIIVASTTTIRNVTAGMLIVIGCLTIVSYVLLYFINNCEHDDSDDRWTLARYGFPMGMICMSIASLDIIYLIFAGCYHYVTNPLEIVVLVIVCINLVMLIIMTLIHINKKCVIKH